VALAPDDAFARATLGLYRTWWRADLDRGLEELQLAVQLNPNLANCHAGLGANLALRGDLAAAREQIDIALRLSPRDPSKASWRAQYCLGALLNGRYEEVVAEGTTALTEFPDSAVLYGGRAAALAQLGRISEAQADVAHVLRLLPGQTVEVVRRQMPPVPNVDRFLEGLRLAGLPEA
jgi:Flp pilus assembly protein TadD